VQHLYSQPWKDDIWKGIKAGTWKDTSQGNAHKEWTGQCASRLKLESKVR